jgi:hypothetical protein
VAWDGAGIWEAAQLSREVGALPLSMTMEVISQAPVHLRQIRNALLPVAKRRGFA